MGFAAQFVFGDKAGKWVVVSFRRSPSPLYHARGLTPKFPSHSLSSSSFLPFFFSIAIHFAPHFTIWTQGTVKQKDRKQY